MTEDGQYNQTKHVLKRLIKFVVVDGSTYVNFNRSPSDCIDNLQNNYTKYSVQKERQENPKDLKIENKLQGQRTGNSGTCSTNCNMYVEKQRDPK